MPPCVRAFTACASASRSFRKPSFRLSVARGETAPRSVPILESFSPNGHPVRIYGSGPFPCQAGKGASSWKRVRNGSLSIGPCPDQGNGPRASGPASGRLPRLAGETRAVVAVFRDFVRNLLGHGHHDRSELVQALRVRRIVEETHADGGNRVVRLVEYRASHRGQSRVALLACKAPPALPCFRDMGVELRALADGSFGEAAQGHPAPEMVVDPVSYTHLRAHETGRNLVCRLL